MDEKSYNHIEATFYLLAERHLTAMLVHRMGRFAPPVPQSRNFTASNSTGSVFSRPNSGENLLLNNSEVTNSRKSAEYVIFIDRNSKKQGKNDPHYEYLRENSITAEKALEK